MENSVTRRQFVRMSTAGAAALTVGLPLQAAPVAGGAKLYSDLLTQWCDGLLAYQVKLASPALRGALLCPACGLVHGRVGDAVYPLLWAAKATGQSKYVEAALAVHAWSESQMSRPDGSWINDVTLSNWKGITVFRTISLAEALLQHGTLLDAKTRASWTDRVANAAKFLDGFISIETGNINYPVTSSLAFALCGELLGDAHYMQRGRELAHASLAYITPAGFLYGEGHPIQKLSGKGYRPVDLGYNVEESLPALALYSVVAKDAEVRAKTVAALRTHLEFMLPDGAWDNSWGTRNYKWSWWGSRTSDGCQPAYVLLSEGEPAFLEAARRNTQLMARCTSGGLLYGGPDYKSHGDLPCIHHTFSHAKALATVLDRGASLLDAAAPASIPRDTAYGVRSYADIGTHLAAVGDWRATVTDYDWEYIETVQAGGANGGGHASGGALSMLYHRTLGPVLVASMTDYKAVEIANQQVVRDGSQMTLTPRIEYKDGGHTYTSLNDLKATLTKSGAAKFEASGQLQTTAHVATAAAATYELAYTLTAEMVQIDVLAHGEFAGPVALILPVVCRADEPAAAIDPQTIRIKKLTLRTTAPAGFSPLPRDRVFNLVPGFECVPLTLTLEPGKRVSVQILAM